MPSPSRAWPRFLRRSTVRAIALNIEIMHAFVRMREVLAVHKALPRKLVALEQRIESQNEMIVEILSG